MMSALTFDTPKDHTKEKSKESIVKLFHAYCSHEFGNDQWNNFLKIDEFNRMILHLQPIYGDMIFSVIADIVATTQNIPIKDLLKNFSEFINKYY